MTPATDGPLQLTNRLNPLSSPVIVSSPESPASDPWVCARAALVSLVVLGIALRVIPLVSDRCLWIDEAMLALNLVERTPRQLLQPLDWNQGAPIGFLLLAKSTLLLFGTAEWSFRMVPFLASVLGTIGFAWVARRLLPAGAAILAVALFAVSPFLISYAGECKQYASDATLAIAMFAAAIGLLHGAGGCRRWALLAIAGAIAVWFSHPVAFVLGGIGTALFLDALVARDRRRVSSCLATIACWLASFGVSYVICLKQLGNNQFLLDYWDGHFLPLPPTTQGDLLWLAEHYFGFLAYPGGLGGTEIRSGGIAAALCIIGLLAMRRDRWPVAVAVVLPALLALAASALHKYPFAGRMLLFLVPLMLLAVARGAWSLAAGLRQSQPFAAVVLVGLLLSATAVESYQSLRRPPRHEQLVPVLDTVRSEWQPGDKVYIYYGAIPAFTYYTRDDPFPPGVTLGNEHRGERTGYRDELATLAGEPRVWLIFSHPHLSEEPMIRGYAEGLGDCRREVRQPGAAAYLFDFRRTK